MDRCHTAEKRALQSCLRSIKSGEPEGYAEVWGTEFSSFCLTEETAAKVEKRRPGLMPADVPRLTRGGRPYLVFSQPKRSRDSLRLVLQQLGAEARRRSRMQKVEGFHLKEHYRTLWEIQEGRCYFSGEPLGTSFEERRFAVDHLQPIAVRDFPPGGLAGTNWPTNLALVTGRVNRMKGGDDAETFLWRLKHQRRRYRQPFEARPLKERRRIDALRAKAFSSFMEKHEASSDI